MSTTSFCDRPIGRYVSWATRQHRTLRLLHGASPTKAGLSNPVEVATQRAALATAALMIPELEQSEEEALAALAMLVGQAPEGFTVEGVPLEALAEPSIAAGLPRRHAVTR